MLGGRLDWMGILVAFVATQTNSFLFPLFRLPLQQQKCGFCLKIFGVSFAALRCKRVQRSVHLLEVDEAPLAEVNAL